MGFDFILTIMFFGIGLETEKVVKVTEQKSVRMFDVTITKGERQMSYEVIYYNNEVKDIRDQEGNYISYFSDEEDDDDCENFKSKEWNEIENIVLQNLN